MTTPSNPSGIPSLPVVGLLAVILFLGLALAPRAFEFRAWPEQSRQYATEEVVDRPLSDAPVVEVAGVERSHSRSAHADRVKGERADHTPARVDESRVDRGSKRAASSRRGDRRPNRAPDPVVPDVVIETPAPAQPDPAPVVPQEPAQLAEVPSTDQVLRPDAPEVTPEAPAAPAFEVVDLEVVDQVLDEGERCDEHGRHRHDPRGNAQGRGKARRSGH